MKTLFHYGSNCDKQRLNKRLKDTAVPKGKAQTVEDFEIAFDVWSGGNKCAAADLVRGGHGKAWGVLYEVPDDSLKTLARIEGSRYEQQCIQVTLGTQVQWAITFLVKSEHRVGNLATSAKYVSHIIKGLRAFDVPDDYVQKVIDIAIANLEAASESAAAQKPALEQLRTPDFLSQTPVK